MYHEWNYKLWVETPNVRSFGGPWCDCALGYSIWHTIAAGVVTREVTEVFIDRANTAGTNQLLDDLSEVVVRPWSEATAGPELDLCEGHALVAAHCRNKNVMQICVMLNCPFIIGLWPDFETRYLHPVIRAFIAESTVLCAQARRQ